METINYFSNLWWNWMGNMFWQATLLIAIISIIDIFLRKWAWPQVRYALWTLILIKLLIPPTWSLKTSVVSHLQPRVEKQLVERILIHQPVIKQQNVQSTTIFETTDIQNKREDPKTIMQLPIENKQENAFSSPAFSSHREKVSLESIAMMFWFAGVLVLLTVLVFKMMRLRRWHKQQKKHSIPQWFHELLVKTAQKFEITNLPAIVFNDKALTPAVYGMFRPVMLLPANYFDHLSEEEAEHVLLHELAHLKRGDLWLHGLTLFLQIIYWFNPLMVWVRRQIKHVREICCDLTVANVLREKTSAYRQTLLNTARELLTETVEPGLGLLGVFEEPFRLVTRLKWLEKKTWENRNRVLATAVIASLFVAASVLPMAGLSTGEQNNQQFTLALTSYTDPLVDLPKNIKEDEEWKSTNYTIKKTDALYAAVLVKEGPSLEMFEDAIQECEDLLREQHIRPLGDPFGRFFSDPENVEKERHYWEVGFMIKHGKKVKPPLEIREVVPMQVASMGVAGVRDTENVWQEFINQLEEDGYVAAFPPAVEIWRGKKYNQPIWKYTEMRIAVFQPEEGYPGMSVNITERPEFTALVLPMRGSSGQHEEAMEKLSRYIKKNKIKPLGNPFGEYYYNWSESPPSEWEWILGYPVDPETEVESPFEIRNFESVKVASTEIPGPINAEFPWTPFIVMSVIEGNIPIGAAMETWTDKGKRSTVNMTIPIINIPGMKAGMKGSFGDSEKEWQEMGENMGEGIKEWAINFSNSLVTGLTGKSIAELEEEENKDLENRINDTNDKLTKALLEQDVDAYLSHVSDDVIINPPLHEEIRGKNIYKKIMIDENRRGVKFRSLNSNILECWQCGDEVFEISTFAFSMSVPESKVPLADDGKSFTIWQEQQDGSLLVKYSMYNTDTHPESR